MVTAKHIIWLIIFLASVSNAVAQDVVVSIDTSATFQQVRGWGIPPYQENTKFLDSLYQNRMLDYFVNHLGCNSYRWEISRRDWEDYSNDNEDPDHFNWDAFKTNSCDERAKSMVLPMKQMVEMRGEKFMIFSSSSFDMETKEGFVPEWMIQDPAEFSEWLIAHLLYVKHSYGVNIDYICIADEPDNHSRFTAINVGEIVKVLGPRLRKEGLTTGIMFPEHASVNGALDYIEKWKYTPEVMDNISSFSYHLNFETSFHSAEKMQIYAIAKSNNIPVIQSNPIHANFDVLYDDLINGGVSYWFIPSEDACLKWKQNKTAFSFSKSYWDIRQITHYVRPGSYRILSNVVDPSGKSKVVAFKKNSNVVVVCKNESPAPETKFILKNLPTGYYAINKGKEELGVQEVKNSGQLSFELENGEIATVYSTNGENLPPLLTEWQATPSYMQLPVSSTRLSVATSDQEKDEVHYQWFVKTQPEEATVSFKDPDKSTTEAIGLTVAGIYEFAVELDDGSNSLIQVLTPVRVVSSNQPPKIYDLIHLRSVYPQLPGNRSTRLSCSIYDPDGDPCTLLWILMKQPEGASATLTSETKTTCFVENLNVPGEYIFRLSASDGSLSTCDSLTVLGHPENNPPVIETIVASPEVITSSDGTVTLSASTKDLDGEYVGCWWKSRSYPSGSKPVFPDQGKATTYVEGLKIPGTYTFTFVAADNISRISKDVKVVVEQ